MDALSVLARFPALRPLIEMTDPPWRFAEIANGMVAATRVHANYSETLWIVDEQRVGARRQSNPDYPGTPVPPIEFFGSLIDAVALLTRRPGEAEQTSSASTS
jgi:hypothetical protein